MVNIVGSHRTHVLVYRRCVQGLGFCESYAGVLAAFDLGLIQCFLFAVSELQPLQLRIPKHLLAFGVLILVTVPALLGVLLFGAAIAVSLFAGAAVVSVSSAVAAAVDVLHEA